MILSRSIVDKNKTKHLKNRYIESGYVQDGTYQDGEIGVCHKIIKQIGNLSKIE